MERIESRTGRVLVRPLGDFPDWAFDLGCPGCRERREVPVTDLIRHYGGRHLVREVMERFSCRRCRAVPVSVALHRGGERVVLREAATERQVVAFPTARTRVGASHRQADLLDAAGADPLFRTRRTG